MKRWLLYLLLSTLSLIAHAAKPLAADRAFEFTVHRLNPNALSLNWKIHNHYYLYKNKIKVLNPKNSNLTLGPLLLPKSITHRNKQGLIQEVYHNTLSIPLSILGTAPGETLINIQYQGCSEDGFCYPPEAVTIKIMIDKDLTLQNATIEAAERQAAAQGTNDLNKTLGKQKLLVTLLIFYLLGILLSFTPCVLPMIPVLSGIIVGHGPGLNIKKAFLLSLSYVLSMSVTYAIVGALIASLGKNLQISMQSPLIITIFSSLFVFLALAMFGFYELKLPSSWQSKLMGKQDRSGHYLGAAIMGALSTLILSPCVSAPMLGALAYSAESKSSSLGGLIFFFLGLGMGTPLLIIGASAGYLLPRSGSWMNGIKVFFGILLMAVAIELIARLIPASFSMILWALLFIASGLYAGALKKGENSQTYILQACGILCFCYGILILIGASMGSTNPLKPLGHLQYTQNNQVNKITVHSLEALEAAVKEAQRPFIMVDFYASWCSSCQYIEEELLKDPKIQEALSQIVLIKADLSDNNEQSQALLKHFDLVAPPALIFLNNEGKEYKDLRLSGLPSSEELLKSLDKIIEQLV